MAATAIITKDEALAYIGITGATTEQEAQMDTLVNGLNAAIERYCNRTFGSTLYTEYLNGKGRQALQLRHYPIISVTSVTYTYPDDSTEAVVSTDYWILYNEGQLKLKPSANHNDAWFEGVHNYTVVYTAGYAAADMPQDLKLAALTWAAYMWERIEGRKHSVSSESFGDRNISYRFDKIPAEVEALLAPFRRLPYA